MAEITRATQAELEQLTATIGDVVYVTALNEKFELESSGATVDGINVIDAPRAQEALRDTALRYMLVTTGGHQIGVNLPDPTAGAPGDVVQIDGPGTGYETAAPSGGGARDNGLIIQYIWTANGDQSAPTDSFLNANISGAVDGEHFFDSVAGNLFTYVALAGGWIGSPPSFLANPTKFLFLDSGVGTYTPVGTETVNQNPDDKVYTWTTTLDAGIVPTSGQKFALKVFAATGVAKKVIHTGLYVFETSAWVIHEAISFRVDNILPGVLLGGSLNEIDLRVTLGSPGMVSVNYVIDNPTSGSADFDANFTGSPTIGELAVALNDNVTATYNNGITSVISRGDVFILTAANTWQKGSGLLTFGGGAPTVSIGSAGSGVVSGLSERVPADKLWEWTSGQAALVPRTSDLQSFWMAYNGFSGIPPYHNADKDRIEIVHVITLGGFYAPLAVGLNPAEFGYDNTPSEKHIEISTVDAVKLDGTNLVNAVDDAAANTAGVKSFGLYRNGAVVQVRLT